MKSVKMIIYNLFPLLAGTFNQWEGHMSRAKDMGFNWIFINPVQEPGASGSIYAIGDYYKFNPVLCDSGTGRSPEAQVREMVKGAEKKGLKLMIDLVINHCSIDSPLLKEHPEWFEHDENGEVVHPWADEDGKKVIWGDLARFDYKKGKNTGLIEYFLKFLRYLIDLGFRGFRCDAAYQVPPGVWERLIHEIKKERQDVMFLAETLGCTLKETNRTAKAGFDFIFNSSKWWDFKSPWLMNQYNLTRESAPSIGFPESHDTVRLCEELDGNISGLKQRYLFTALFSAGVMITTGFEFGFRRKPHVVETTFKDWEDTEIDITSFIRRVNRIKETYRVFQGDVPTQMYKEENPMVLVMWKGSSDAEEEALLILNRDIYNRRVFHTPDIYDFFESKSPLEDVSPDNPLSYIPRSFTYDLGPGEGRVLVMRGE